MRQSERNASVTARCGLGASATSGERSPAVRLNVVEIRSASASDSSWLDSVTASSACFQKRPTPTSATRSPGTPMAQNILAPMERGLRAMEAGTDFFPANAHCQTCEDIKHA